MHSKKENDLKQHTLEALKRSHELICNCVSIPKVKKKIPPLINKVICDESKTEELKNHHSD